MVSLWDLTIDEKVVYSQLGINPLIKLGKEYITSNNLVHLDDDENKEKAATLKSTKKSTTKIHTQKQSKKILKSQVQEEIKEKSTDEEVNTTNTLPKIINQNEEVEVIDKESELEMEAGIIQSPEELAAMEAGIDPAAVNGGAPAQEVAPNQSPIDPADQKRGEF